MPDNLLGYGQRRLLCAPDEKHVLLAAQEPLVAGAPETVVEVSPGLFQLLTCAQDLEGWMR